jgi:sugar phosphate isomerase/epimerase
MGDGVIEIGRLREAVERVGYRGPIEVEIFNDALWTQPADEIVKQVVARFTEFV